MTDRPDVPWITRVRYRADEVLSRGTLGVILWLGAITVAFIVVAALVITALDWRFNRGTAEGFSESIWQSLLRVMDPGTMAGDRGWAVRIVALVITLVGIFVVSALIGIVATGLDQKLDDLRKGRSFVVEEAHTVVLGWSPRLFTLVSELVLANENRGGGAIVVLADRDKTEMEDDIRARVPDLRRSKLVCRTGDIANPADLAIVNVDDARSIVVLGDDGPEGDGDAVRALLAIRAHTHRIGEVPVIAEVTEPRTVRALDGAFGDDVLTVQSTGVVARVTAQSCRRSGLSAVVQELLNFSGDEIYFQDTPSLTGHTFGEAMLALPTASLIGRRRADGLIEIGPSMNVVLSTGDEIIAIDRRPEIDVASPVVSAALPDVEVHPAPPTREQMLVVGWNRLGPNVLRELDRYAAPDSLVRVAIDPTLVDAEALLADPLTNLHLAEPHRGDDHEAVERLTAEHTFTSVMILSYESGISPSEADARSLLALLAVDRGITRAGQRVRPRIVMELLDARNADLARVSGADDLVVSDSLASYAMAQFSEHPERAEVFRQLYTADGSSLFMELAAPYAPMGEVAWSDVVATSAASGYCAVGWRRVTATGAEVTINPPKSTRVTFGADDDIIVIG